jgi:FkbM family methyltransferase
MIGRIRDAFAWRWWYLRTLFVRGVVLRLQAFPRVFADWNSATAYVRAILSTQTLAEPVAINVKSLAGKRLLCRPATSDPWVLWDVFANQFQQLPKEIESPRTIVDLGANVGYTAAWYAARYPAARVIAVEMDSANHELAQRNIAAFGDRCTVLNAAIWDSDGELEYDGGEEQGFRVATLDPEQVAIRRRSVRSRSLDSLFEELGLEHVDFVKMDIEGAESVVFSGSLKWLECVQALKIEVHPPMTLMACQQVLELHGFSCRADEHHDHSLIAVRPTAIDSLHRDSKAIASGK